MNIKVSEINKKMFTNSVVLSLKNILNQCGVDPEKLDEETKIKFLYIALEDSQKKIDEFVGQYKSYKHKRKAFQQYILNII